MNKKKTSHVVLAYSTIGIQLAVTVTIFILGGYKLDTYLNRSPIFTSVGALAGMLIGFYNLFRELKSIEKLEEKQKKENKE